jgi:hypothetical protein
VAVYLIGRKPADIALRRAEASAKKAPVGDWFPEIPVNTVTPKSRRAATVGEKVRKELYWSSNGKQKFKTTCKSRTEITQAIWPEAC